MSKKKSKLTEVKDFPNFTFEEGSLNGENVKDLIAEGLGGIERITRYIASEQSEMSFSYLCTGSIVYELGKAIALIVEDNRGNERILLSVLDDLFGAICWLPPLVYLASQKFGYDNKRALLASENEEDLRLAVESIRDLLKKAYVDNPLKVENDPRCGCIDYICGCYE